MKKLIRKEIDERFLKICKTFNLHKSLKAVDDRHLLDSFLGFLDCAYYSESISIEEYRFITNSCSSVLNLKGSDFTERCF